MNLDDVYDVQPPDLEEEYDIEGGPLEQEFEVQPDIEQEFDLAPEEDQSGKGLAERVLDREYKKLQDYEAKPWSEVLPQLGGVVLGAALPASIPAQVVGGLLLNAGARGTTAALQGGDTQAVIDAANPLNHKLQSALDIAIPVGAGAITRGMKAPALDESLPDFAKATSANAELPPRHEVLTTPELPDDVPMSSVEPQTAWGRIRQFTMNPKRYLIRADDPGAFDASTGAVPPPSTERIAGETLEGYRTMREQVQQQGEYAIRDIEKDLTRSQRYQVGLILDGKLDPTAVDTPVLDAATKARKFLDEIGTRATGIEGMQTVDEATGQRIPFEKITERDYFPHRLLDEGENTTVSLSARGQKRYNIDTAQKQRLDKPRKYDMDVGNQLRAYVDKFSRDMAASHYFGPQTEGTKWGENADSIWKNLIAEEKPLAAAAFESRMDALMHPEKFGNAGKVMQMVQRGTSKLALPTSAITSWSQVGTNLGRNGLSNTVEGMTRWMRDPSLRKLYESSGALNPGFTEMATENAPRQTLGARWMASTERGLRGILNSGTVPYAEDLIRKVQAGDRSRVTLRKLRELGVELAEAEKGPTADLMRRIAQNSSDALQLQAHDPVNAGEFFDDPNRRVMAAYMQYPAEAARLAHDMVVDPVVKGVRNLDPREVGLGVGRLGRWAAGTGAAAAAAELARSAMSGREPDPTNAALNTADTIGGLPSNFVTTPARGFDPTKGLLQPPLVSMVREAWSSGGRLFGDTPERGAAELALDLAAFLDPTGAAAIARQLGRAQIREAYKQ